MNSNAYFHGIPNRFSFLRALDEQRVEIENALTGLVLVYDLNSDAFQPLAA